jgi:hypothetical protein
MPSRWSSRVPSARRAGARAGRFGDSGLGVLAGDALPDLEDPRLSLRTLDAVCVLTVLSLVSTDAPPAGREPSEAVHADTLLVVVRVAVVVLLTVARVDVPLTVV